MFIKNDDYLKVNDENMTNIALEMPDIIIMELEIERLEILKLSERQKKIVEIVKCISPLSGEKISDLWIFQERPCDQICPFDLGWYIERLPKLAILILD